MAKEFDARKNLAIRLRHNHTSAVLDTQARHKSQRNLPRIRTHDGLLSLDVVMVVVGAKDGLGGELRNFTRGESAVEDGDLVESTFPVGAIVAAAAQEDLIASRWEVSGCRCFDF